MGKKRSREAAEAATDPVDEELEAEMRAVEEIRAERENQPLPDREIRYNKEVRILFKVKKCLVFMRDVGIIEKHRGNRVTF